MNSGTHYQLSLFQFSANLVLSFLLITKLPLSSSETERANIKAFETPCRAVSKFSVSILLLVAFSVSYMVLQYSTASLKSSISSQREWTVLSIAFNLVSVFS